MKIIVAGLAADMARAYTPLLHAGQQVLGLVEDVATLCARVVLESPDGLLLDGALCDTPAELAALLTRLGLPAVVRAPQSWHEAPELAGWTLVAESASWVAAAQALEQAVGTAAADAAPAAPGPLPAEKPNFTASTRISLGLPLQAHCDPRQHSPLPRPFGAGASSAASPTSTSTPTPTATAPTGPVAHLALYGTQPGVGTSTLAATLGALVAEAALPALTLWPTPDLAWARWGYAPTAAAHVVSLGPHWYGYVGAALPATLPPVQAVVQVLPALTADAPSTLLVARPTGAGRLATVRAVYAARATHTPLRGIVCVGRGSQPLHAWEQGLRDDGVTLPVWGLPDDPLVYAHNERQGHAAETRHYGGAVRALVRTWLPDLRWPAAETAPALAAPERPAKARWRLNLNLKLPQLIWTED